MSNRSFVQINVIFFLLSLLMTPIKSWSYLSTVDSGELVPINQYRLILEPQANPFNLSVHFDAGISDSSQLRLSFGSGESGSHFDFSFKSVPIPSLESQPAIGYKVDTIFANEKGSTNSLTVRISPLISNNYLINKNRWTPYAALPLGVSVRKSSSSTPVHLVVGTELTPHTTPDMQFGAELGIGLKESFSYFSAFVSFYFESTESESDTK